jgi:hypothetical protein
VGVKASVNTKLHTEFVLQIWKQQENSAMLLASNKQPHKKKTQQNRLKTHRKGLVKNIDLIASKKLITHTTIWNAPNAEFPKRNFHLVSNTLVLF